MRVYVFFTPKHWTPHAILMTRANYMGYLPIEKLQLMSSYWTCTWHGQIKYHFETLPYIRKLMSPHLQHKMVCLSLLLCFVIGDIFLPPHFLALSLFGSKLLSLFEFPNQSKDKHLDFQIWGREWTLPMRVHRMMINGNVNQYTLNQTIIIHLFR